MRLDAPMRQSAGTRSVWIAFLVALGCALAGLGAVWKVWFSGSALPSVFSLAEVDLGRVPQGATRLIEFELRNPTETSVYLFDLEVSCGCMKPEIPKHILAPGEAVPIRILASPPAGEGSFSDWVRPRTSDARLDHDIVRIEGERYKVFGMPPEIQLGIQVSEAPHDVQLSAMVLSSFLTEEEWRRVLSDASFHGPMFAQGLRASLVQESIRILECEGGNTLVEATVAIAPSSLRRRLDECFCLLPLPERIGGGFFRIPVYGSLVPNIRVQPEPILRLPPPSLELHAEFYLYPEEAAPGEFGLETADRTSGDEAGLCWSLIPAADPACLKLAVTKGASADSGDLERVSIRTLGVPVRYRGRPHTVTLAVIQPAVGGAAADDAESG